MPPGAEHFWTLGLWPWYAYAVTIPFAARLFSIVDVWDALLSERRYRPAWSRDKTIAYIRDQSGKHFDPEVVRVFGKFLIGIGVLKDTNILLPNDVLLSQSATPI